MKTLLILLCGLVSCTYSATAQVVVSEFQPNPIDDEPEWVELYNSSDAALTDYSLYLHDTKTVIRIQHLNLPPHGYAVLTSDTSELKNHRSIPPACSLVQAKLPSLNNTTDVIVLRNQDSTLLDSIFYNAKWIKKGISFERKFTDRPANSQLNLFASLSADSATCGYTNSVSPRAIDISISTFHFLKDSSALIAQAINAGLETVPKGEIRIYLDKNQNDSAESDEIVRSLPFENLKTNDSLLFRISMNDLHDQFQLYGEVKCLALCQVTGDTRGANDTARTVAFLSYPQHSILINEILYDPESMYSEFIELYNNSEFPINLNKWQLHDKPTSTGADTLQFPTIIVQPQSYTVVTWDSSFFKQFPELIGSPNVLILHSSMSLNSDGDLISLRDGNGRIIDSLSYFSSWHDQSLSPTKGVSLEKIKPSLPSEVSSSWSSCGDWKAHSTPTKRNSLTLENTSEALLTATPNPFSPTSGILHQTIISFKLNSMNCIVNATIYSKEGIHVTTILNTAYSASQGAITWNGKDVEGNVVPPGSYILVLECTDRTSGEITMRNLLLVVGK